MPSKPPQSTAQKKRQRTATKLPGKIAKRFKMNKIKAREEEMLWEKITATKQSETWELSGSRKQNQNKVTFEEVSDSMNDNVKTNIKPMLQIVTKKKVIPKKKGENNRQSRQRLRELIL